MSTSTKGMPDGLRGLAARKAGVLLLLTAVATGISVFTRIAADADQPTIEESLRAIATNTGMYTVAGVARILSGIALAVAAWQLWRSTTIRENLGTPLVPSLLGASGVITAASGVCALVLAASVGDPSEVAASGTQDAVSTLRWVTGKLGFTAAGLALAAVGLRQWSASRVIAAASVVIGVAMLLIWVDAATIVHRISGNAFFLWLVVIGVLLFRGTVERHLSAMRR